MAHATMFQTVPRRAAKVTTTASPAMLRSKPVPWVMVLASSSTGMRFMGGWGIGRYLDCFALRRLGQVVFAGPEVRFGETQVSSNPIRRFGLTSVLGYYLPIKK